MRKKKTGQQTVLSLIVDGRQYSALQCTCMGKEPGSGKLSVCLWRGIQHVIPT